VRQFARGGECQAAALRFQHLKAQTARMDAEQRAYQIEFSVFGQRECIFASQLDESIRALRIRVLKSALHNPRINSNCERMIGTIRREFLDWLIPTFHDNNRAMRP
jgi:hypothetical protein